MILPPHSTDDMCERFHCLFLDLFADCSVAVVFNVVIMRSSALYRTYDCNFDVLRTVHLSIILAINQLNV